MLNIFYSGGDGADAGEGGEVPGRDLQTQGQVGEHPGREWEYPGGVW